MSTRRRQIFALSAVLACGLGLFLIFSPSSGESRVQGAESSIQEEIHSATGLKDSANETSGLLTNDESAQKKANHFSGEDKVITQSNPQAQERFRIAGIVRNFEFLSIPEATITLRQWEDRKQLASTKTGQDGRFYIEVALQEFGLPVEFFADAPGYVTSTIFLHAEGVPVRKEKYSRFLQVERGTHELPFLEITLSSAATLAGTIRDAQGSLLADSSVHVDIRPFWSDRGFLNLDRTGAPLSERSLAAQVLVGSDGRFSCDRVPAGQKLFVLAWHPFSIPEMREMSAIPPGEVREADFFLQPAAWLEGVLVKDSGQFLAHHEIAWLGDVLEASPSDPSVHWVIGSEMRWALTDDSGRFLVPSLHPGSQGKLQFQAEGTGKVVSLSQLKPGLNTIRIILKEGGVSLEQP